MRFNSTEEFNIYLARKSPEYQRILQENEELKNKVKELEEELSSK